MTKLVSLASVFALAGCMMGGDSSSLMGFGGGGVERGDMPQELADRSASVTGMNLWDNNSSDVVVEMERLEIELGGGSSSLFGVSRESSIGQGISQTQMDTFQSTKYNNAVKILKNVLAIYNGDKDANTSKEDLRKAWLVLGLKKSLFDSFYDDKGYTDKEVYDYIRSNGEIGDSIIGQYFDVYKDGSGRSVVDNWNPTFYNIENVDFSVFTNKDIDDFTFVLEDDVIKGINWNGNLLTRTLDAKGDEYFVSGDNVYAIRYESRGKNLLKYADFGEIIVFQDKGGNVLNNLNNLGSELFAGGYDNKKIKIGDFDFEKGDHTMNFAGKAIGKVAFYTEDLKTNDKNKTGDGTWYTQNATIAFDSYGNTALKMPFLTQGNGGYDVNVYNTPYSGQHAEFLDGNGAREGVTDNFYVTCYGAGNKPSEAIGQVKVTDVETSNDGYYKETMNFDAVAGASGGNVTYGIIDCYWCSK